MNAPAGLAADRGFTLVELLLVVAVLSILAIGSTLAVGRAAPSGRPDAQLLAALDAELAMRAQVARQAQALEVTASGYRRLERSSEGWHERGTAGDWSGRADWGAAGTRTLIFLPDGRASPYAVDFRDAALGWRCVRTLWSEPQCQRT